MNRQLHEELFILLNGHSVWWVDIFPTMQNRKGKFSVVPEISIKIGVSPTLTRPVVLGVRQQLLYEGRWRWFVLGSNKCMNELNEVIVNSGQHTGFYFH